LYPGVWSPHSLLVIFYHLLKEAVAYKDLGADYFEQQNPERLRRYLVKRLEGLGYAVSLSPQQGAASQPSHTGPGVPPTRSCDPGDDARPDLP
jgi:hypothetical protein